MLALALTLATFVPISTDPISPDQPTHASVARGHASAPTAIEDPAEAKLHSDLIGKLLGLATWCNDKELFLQRDNLWRSVLALESENAEARKGLRYARDGQGKWKDPAPREVKDRNAAALPEFSKKRSEVVAVWREQLFALLDSEKADAARREAACEEVLSIDPEDAFVHGLRGETKSGESWVLEESAAGATRRAELHGVAQKAHESAPAAQKADPTPDDLALLSPWKASSESDGMHLVIQTGDAEALEFVRTAHAACALAEALCGQPMPPTKGFTAYVLTDPAEREKLMAAIPGASDADKKAWKATAGFGLPRTASVVLWDKDGKRRLDCFARHFAASQLYGNQHIDSKLGWLFEGFGLYCAHEIVGSRFTWFVSAQPGESAALRSRLFAPKTDWFAEAATALKGTNAPKLSELLGKELGALKLEDMLVAHAFVAYLAEGLPTKFPEILKRIGAGESSVKVVEELTGRPLAETEKRLARWLSERK